MYDYRALVKRVVDGDTIDVQIDLGFSIYVKKRIRFAKIDAYETSLRGDTTEEEKQKGIEAKEFVKSMVEGKAVLLITHKEKGKYGRYIAEVLYYKDNDPEKPINLNDELVEKGYAVYKEY